MLVWCSWVPMVVLLIAILLLLLVAALLAWGAARMLQVSEPKLLFGRFLIIKNISKTRSNECCRNSRLLQHLHFGSSFHDQKRTENWTNECGRHSTLRASITRNALRVIGNPQGRGPGLQESVSGTKLSENSDQIWQTWLSYLGVFLGSPGLLLGFSWAS